MRETLIFSNAYCILHVIVFLYVILNPQSTASTAQVVSNVLLASYVGVFPQM